ncbi:DMT family transporter [Stakelama saccharophila]|uniref:EamA family transporter n=1 Tax=Stakelama saccharophila TaxID=3075605 RepID=A0ABZ0BBW9_9SPHN|nr:EamA family transporter [Stakelama sp. W311]WNO54338.1 EamA family transporter [Stakelama sp. W311]
MPLHHASHGPPPPAEEDRPRSTRLAVLIPFGVVTLIWGSTWIVIRDQIGQVPPSWSVTYRFLIAGAVMLALALWRRERFPADGRGLLFAAALGLSQFCLNFNFVYRAEQYVTSGLVAATIALLLVPNAILARIFLGQRMGGQLLLGSALAVIGVGLLFVQEAHAADPGSLGNVRLGITIAVGGMLAASVANVMQATQFSRRYPMVPMLAIAMLMGAAMNGAIAWTTLGPPILSRAPGYWAGVLYLGLFASALNFTLYFNVIRMIGPAKAAYSSVLVPIIAMGFSTVFEGYRWSAFAISGGVLAIFGLVVALRARRPNR